MSELNLRGSIFVYHHLLLPHVNKSASQARLGSNWHTLNSPLLAWAGKVGRIFMHLLCNTSNGCAERARIIAKQTGPKPTGWVK